MKRLFMFFVVLCCGLHLSAMGGDTETISISGKVVYQDEGIRNIRLQILDKDKQKIENSFVDTDSNGVFSISNVPADGFIQIDSISGHENMIIPVKQINGIISLQPMNQNLSQINVNKFTHQQGEICADYANKIQKGIGKVFDCGADVKCLKCVPEDNGCMPGYEVRTVNGEKVCEPEIQADFKNLLPLDQKQCLNAGRVWNNKKARCMCNATSTDTHFDIEKKQCVCDDENKVIESNKCVCVLKKGENNVKEIDSKKCEITKCDDGYSISDDKKSCVKNEIDNEKLKQAEDDYRAAKEKEQSKENRMLTAATVAATGIGGMELARGLAEQSVDRDAAEDMEAYIATMRCEYGDGKSVKTIDVKDTSIELPGGNDQNLMNYRAQYLTLAADLKARKTALGMKPGIESEEILDKATVGLYDDENTGITSGHEASLYRAQMLKSESDQTNLDEASAASQRRVTGGAIATGLGVVGGALGNQIINGELGEKIKENKDRNSLISEIKNGLKSRGFTNIDKLDFSKIDISTLIKLQDIDWNNLSVDSQKDITKVLNTTNTTSFRSSFSKLGLGDAFK